MLGIKSKRILTPNGFLDGTIFLEEGKIKSIESPARDDNSDTILDAGNFVVMPGLIDPHVHINEPGRTEWEGFETATTAAAAGGITTLIDMPLNSTPVTTSKASLEIKIASANKSLNVNCGFYGGVVPGNSHELESLIRSGVFGLKAFLTHSGIDDFPNMLPTDLHEAMTLLKKYDRPLLVHCELSSDHEGIPNLKKNPQSYLAYLASRPKEWEDKAIESMIALCRKTNAHVHIVHLSSATALPAIIQARKEGLPLTVETAPHYLFFHAETIPDANTLFKCAPPIRERRNNDKLWEALLDGHIDFIATDHSPAPPALKEITSGNFEKAWGGIAGLQFSLQAVWTGARKKNIRIDKVMQWLSEMPAEFLKLNSRKGRIEKGYDADLVIWDPEKEVIVSDNEIFHRHKSTPYSGRQLTGEVLYTFVAGNLVYDKYNKSGLPVLKHSGTILLRNS